VIHAEFNQWTKQKGIQTHTVTHRQRAVRGRDEGTSRNSSSSSSSGEALVADA